MEEEPPRRALDVNFKNDVDGTEAIASEMSCLSFVMTDSDAKPKR